MLLCRLCPGLCRKKECFILAANYLQQVDDLHEKEDIVKNIIMFYTKARSFKQLSRFYNQVQRDREIDLIFRLR